jgi:peptide/nickel transport system substrate-binding protein
VRKAMMYAFDRQEILDKIAHGIGQVSDVPTPVDAPYHVNGYTNTPFDIAKANKMLDDDGWKLGADGVRAKNGTRLSLDYAAIAGLQDVDNQIELERANWKKIGVEINVRHYPAALMFAPIQQGGVVYGDKWDLIGFSWQNEAIGDYSQIYACNAFPPNGQNNPRWCNQKANAAMMALYGHYDQAERNRDVETFVREFVNDMPVMVSYQRQDIYAYNKDLKNFHPNNVSLFDNMMDVDI